MEELALAPIPAHLLPFVYVFTLKDCLLKANTLIVSMNKTLDASRRLTYSD